MLNAKECASAWKQMKVKVFGINEMRTLLKSCKPAENKAVMGAKYLQEGSWARDGLFEGVRKTALWRNIVRQARKNRADLIGLL